jgi:hypothetical protein
MHKRSRRQFLSLSSCTALAGAAFVPMPFSVRLRAAPAAGERDAEGYTPLFNGRDLSGWVPVNVAPDTFIARDEMIVTTGLPTGVMRTERHYENFDLELEWRHLVRRGNAGLFVYSEPITAPGVPFSKSIEIQILDGDSSEGVATGHGDVFSIHGARMTPDRPHPRGWERCLPSERRARPYGEWNHYRVESRDGRLTLAVNGKVVSGASECRPRRGYICLESEGSECHFRNLRIREWPGSNPPPDEVASLAVGFESLYTGLDLSGWQVESKHRGHWQAHDWILACNGRGADVLRSASHWGDAEFIVDWRIQGGGSAGLLPRGSQEHEILLEPTSNRWVRTRFNLKGDRLTFTHNDEAPLTRELSGIPRAGPLGLRHHKCSVQFANLYVRQP